MRIPIYNTNCTFFSYFAIIVHIPICFTKKNAFTMSSNNKYFMKMDTKEENRTYEILFQLNINSALYKNLMIKYHQIFT